MGLLDREWFWDERRKREGLPPMAGQCTKAEKRALKVSSEELKSLKSVPPTHAILAAQRMLAKRRKRNNLKLIFITALIVFIGIAFMQL